MWDSNAKQVLFVNDYSLQCCLGIRRNPELTVQCRPYSMSHLGSTNTPIVHAYKRQAKCHSGPLIRASTTVIASALLPMCTIHALSPETPPTCPHSGPPVLPHDLPRLLHHGTRPSARCLSSSAVAPWPSWRCGPEESAQPGPVCGQSTHVQCTEVA